MTNQDIYICNKCGLEVIYDQPSSVHVWRHLHSGTVICQYGYALVQKSNWLNEPYKSVMVRPDMIHSVKGG